MKNTAWRIDKTFQALFDILKAEPIITFKGGFLSKTPHNKILANANEPIGLESGDFYVSDDKLT